MNRRFLVSLAAMLAAPIVLAAAQALPRALASAEPGLWEYRHLEGDSAPQRRCIRDMTALAQVEHAGRQCTRVTIADEARATTIHYTCTGGGFGRSTLEQVTPRSYTIDTQGISDGLPFHHKLNARRVGNC